MLRPFLAIVATTAALGVAGVLLVTPDGSGLLQPLDDVVHNLVATAGWHGDRSVVWAVSALVPLGVTIGLLLWPPRASLAWRDGARIMAATAVASAASLLIALVVHRPAPTTLGDAGAAHADHSFPSSIGAATVALLLITARGRLSRRGVATLTIVVAAATAALRVGTDTSWLLDELAGAALGTVIALAMARTPRAHHRRPHHRVVMIATAALAIALVVPVGITYGRYLMAPGSAAVTDRTVEYLRDHGMAQVVDRTESWWLWIHQPSTHGHLGRLPAAPLGVAAGPLVARPTSTVPSTTAPASTTTTIPPSTPLSTAAPVSSATTPPTAPVTAPPSDTALPPSIPPVYAQPLPGEGQWALAATDAAGRPAIATTTFRPDPGHPTIVAAVAWMSRPSTRFSLIAGLHEPGGGAGPAGAQIPAGQRGDVLAAFNSGYRLQDTPGGAVEEGRVVRRLQPGVATAIIRPDGTLDVGTWGTEIDPGAPIAAARQNLHLLVDGGAVVPGVPLNEHQQWGTVKNTLPTWRSALGVTATGDVVYAAGDQLTLGVIANVMVRAGAVRAMELDIHKGMVTFNLFTHDTGMPVGHKLLPTMPKPASRYLSPDWRDFFTVVPA